MLIHFDSPRICLHDGGSICLAPRIRSTGIFGPGIDLLVPRTALGGDQIPRDTCSTCFVSTDTYFFYKKHRFFKYLTKRCIH